MKAAALHVSFAALLAVGGCASAGRAIGGPELEKHVLAHAGPTKLAAALATDLMNRPADDPLRLSPQMAGLRGLMDAPVMSLAAAPQTPAVTARFAPALVAAITPRAIESLAPAAQSFALAIAAATPVAAPAPKKPVFAVALGKFDDAGIASSVWAELASADPLAVKGLIPRLSGGKLIAGPIEDEESAAGRCTAFAALGVECATAAFGGKALPGPMSGSGA
jgi:hypothetical protein